MAAETKDLGKILELVRRCMALSTSSNPNEAALAAAKAQELIAKYNLDLSRLQGTEAPAYEKHGFVSDIADAWERKQNYAWQVRLISGVAEANFCRVVLQSHVSAFTLIGKRHNIEVAEYLFQYLSGEIMRLAADAWKARQAFIKKGGQMSLFGGGVEAQYSDPNERANRAVWMRDFCLGAAETVSKRLQEQKQEQQAAADMRALVVSSDAELAKALKEFYPRTGQYRGGTSRYGSARGAGRAAGSSIGIRVGVGAGTAAAGSLR